MKFILLVEGGTEKLVLPNFFKRWFERQQLKQSIGIQIDNSKSCDTLITKTPQKAKDYLKKPDVIAVIGLLDLYGPENFYPTHAETVDERYQWAKRHMEGRVNHPNFRQHFAVHETEAWLLSDPSIFPSEARKSIAKKSANPEIVNFDLPPAKLLDQIYEAQFTHGYKKTRHGAALFSKLDPQIAYERCPYLKLMLDEMLTLAQDAGL